MRDFVFHRPRFLRSRRSHSPSPRPSPADDCDNAPVSPSCLGPSRPPPSRPSSRQDVDAATSTSYLLEPGNPLHQNSTAPSPLKRARFDFRGPSQSSPSSHSVTPISAVPSNSNPVLAMLSSRDSVDIQLAPPSDNTHSIQAQQYLAPPPSPYVPATPSQRSLHSETTVPPGGRDSSPRQQKGMFENAHNFSMIAPTFVDGNIAMTNYINITPSQFMKDLLEETIPGAASDSSARYPPPRCHPGTRLAVLERCLYFIANCDGEQKIRWVVGFAGVGKSAIMQSVADYRNLPVTCYASVFFSISGRSDGTKTITTLCYQLAVKSAPYRELIEREVTRDPSLLQSSMPVQFEKFIIQPFIRSDQLKAAGRILIIIDGLDECNNPDIQVELLHLISNFCITYPSSPLVWLIASRPERHIKSFFARVNIMPTYEKEEIQVDSDEGRADVERFLREKLDEIKGGSDSFDPHLKWPEEKDFWKLAEAAGGLFAYADTVIRYIRDTNVGNPVLQLSEVLKVIDNLPMTDISRAKHPMALLDALYARILSKVPDKVIVHTRKLVLALASDWNEVLSGQGSFVDLCNWLAMTPDEAYAAVNQLQSLLHTPKRDRAHLETLRIFHKSFLDYVFDSSRSEFFPDMRHKNQLKTECAFRVLNEAPDGINFGLVDYNCFAGTLRRGPGTGDKISLTWPVDGRDKYTRLTVYKLAIGEVVKELRNTDSTTASEFCIRLLITRFCSYHSNFEELLPQHVFDESRRHEFMRCGILKQMSLKAVVSISINPSYHFKLRFRRPARAVAPGDSPLLNAAELPSDHPTRAVTSLFDPWSSSCQHKREGEWEEGKDQDWKTTLGRNAWDLCRSCFEQFDHQLKFLKNHSPDHTVPVLFTFMGDCCVEFRYVDPDDGISEWIYWFWIQLVPEERKLYGSTV